MVYEVYASGKIPRINILSMGCAEEPESTRSGPTTRMGYIIHYCLSGHGYFLGNRVNKGEGFIITPGMTVEYHPSQNDPWRYLWLIIETDDIEYFLRYYNADKETGIFSYDFADVLEEQYRTLKRGQTVHISPLDSLSCYLNILKHHSVSKTESNKAALYATLAKEYIETNYYLHPSIGALAKHLNISQSYLYRVFTEEHGVSPKEYLNRFCMEQAKRLLRTSDMNISQIATAVGYSDVLAFSAFFSKRKGCSPTAYRNSKKKI